MKINIKDIENAINKRLNGFISSPEANQSDVKKFEEMIERDQTLYANLVMADVQLQDAGLNYFQPEVGRDLNFETKYYSLRQKINDLIKSYEERQQSITESELFRVQKSITKAQNSVTDWAKGYYRYLRTKAGLGDFGLSVPLIIGIGAVISFGIAAFFVNRYYQKTLVDYNEGLKVIGEVSETNPQLANKMLRELNTLQRKQQSGGFFSKFTKTATVAGIVFGVYFFDVFGVQTKIKKLT